MYRYKGLGDPYNRLVDRYNGLRDRYNELKNVLNALCPKCTSVIMASLEAFVLCFCALDHVDYVRWFPIRIRFLKVHV